MSAAPQPSFSPSPRPEPTEGDLATLKKSRDYCRDLTRHAARNFHYGLKLLPEAKREAMYALYAYMRLVDDIADGESPGNDPARRGADLDQWEAQTRQAIAAADGYAQLPRGHIVWPAFSEMVHAYHVPPRVFQDMIAGQRQDLDAIRMPDFAALREYCYRVASVVGVASLYVFGFDGGEATLKLGVDRGIAFQLTNILRDLREDSSRGRCYLPESELAEYGVTAQEIASGKNAPGFRRLMDFQIARARDFYDRSAPLEKQVHADARPTLEAMTSIYRGVLEKIARRPEAVLKGRVGLSTFAKLRIAWQALRHHRG